MHCLKPQHNILGMKVWYKLVKVFFAHTLPGSSYNADPFSNFIFHVGNVTYPVKLTVNYNSKILHR